VSLRYISTHPVGMILFFVFTAGVVARLLVPDSDNVEAVVVTAGSLVGVFVAVMAWAMV